MKLVYILTTRLKLLYLEVFIRFLRTKANLTVIAQFQSRQV